MVGAIYIQLHNKNIEIGNSQVNGIFSCHPFSPSANKYLHIDQINFVTWPKKVCYFTKIVLLKNQPDVTIREFYFYF
jgi:hypothetical protein